MILLAVGLLMTETTSPARRPQPVIGALPQACALDGRGMVGKTYDPAMASAMLTRAGLRSVRVVTPGTMSTQDMREDRLTIVVDDAGRILRVYCG